MAEAIHGKDVIIELLIDADYYPILCGTDCSFSRTPEFIPITGPESGLFREFMVRREEWSMSVSGLTKVANAATLSFFYMLQTSVRRTQQTVRMTFEDAAGAAKQITGSVYIGQLDINGPATEFSSASIELKGTGGYTIEDVEPPVVTEYEYFSDYWQTVNGQNYISGASSGEYTGVAYTLGATDIPMLVDVEGTSYNLVTGTPTAGERECRFTTSPQRITFPADLIFDGTQRVFVMFKRPI